jgi:hypothetical protein
VPPAKSLMRTLRPFVLEVVQALGDDERQVVERRLAADGDVHVALLDLLCLNAVAAATRPPERSSRCINISSSYGMRVLRKSY